MDVSGTSIPVQASTCGVPSEEDSIQQPPVIKRSRGRPRKDGTPAQPRVRVKEPREDIWEREADVTVSQAGPGIGDATNETIPSERSISHPISVPAVESERPRKRQRQDIEWSPAHKDPETPADLAKHPCSIMTVDGQMSYIDYLSDNSFREAWLAPRTRSIDSLSSSEQRAFWARLFESRAQSFNFVLHIDGRKFWVHDRVLEMHSHRLRDLIDLINPETRLRLHSDQDPELRDASVVEAMIGHLYVQDYAKHKDMPLSWHIKVFQLASEEGLDLLGLRDDVLQHIQEWRESWWERANRKQMLDDFIQAATDAFTATIYDPEEKLQNLIQAIIMDHLDELWNIYEFSTSVLSCGQRGRQLWDETQRRAHIQNEMLVQCPRCAWLFHFDFDLGQKCKECDHEGGNWIRAGRYVDSRRPEVISEERVKMCYLVKCPEEDCDCFMPRDVLGTKKNHGGVQYLYKGECAGCGRYRDDWKDHTNGRLHI